MFEPLQVEARDDRQRFDAQLLRELLLGVALGANQFGVRSEVLQTRETLQTVDQRLRLAVHVER